MNIKALLGLVFLNSFVFAEVHELVNQGSRPVYVKILTAGNYDVIELRIDSNSGIMQTGPILAECGKVLDNCIEIPPGGRTDVRFFYNYLEGNGVVACIYPDKECLAAENNVRLDKIVASECRSFAITQEYCTPFDKKFNDVNPAVSYVTIISELTG